jgi:two-component system sensor histidine kinase YesM
VSIEDGEINIKCFKTDSSLVFEVSNSGYGITPEEIEEIYNTIKDQNVNKGVGMRNVYQRLKLYYGDNADIEIESILDEQTTIRLILPLIEVKE